MDHVRRMRFKDDQRGTALIEFALILPFLLVITLTVVDLSRAFYIKSLISSAAREGARTAVEMGAPLGNDNATVQGRATMVLAPLTGGGSPVLSSVVVLVEALPSSGYNKVTVSGQFHWLYLGALNYFGASSFASTQTLTAVAVFHRAA